MHPTWNALAAACLLQVSHSFAGEPIAPYKAVTATRDTFACLGSKVELGPMLLPAHVTAGQHDVLAAPVQLFGEPDVLANVHGSAGLPNVAGDTAEWEWKGESGAFRIESHLTAEQDGLCWYEISLTPKSSVAIHSLRLLVPHIASTARYLHTANYTWGTFSQGLQEAGGNWSGAFMPYIWLGDEERGLAWCAEDDRQFALKNAARALEVITTGSTVLFAVNIIDNAQVVDKPITLKFGLQATPVKPVSFAWRAKARMVHNITFEADDVDSSGRTLLDTLHEAGARTVIFHDEWTNYYGKVTTPYDKELRELIDACHKRGMKLLVYMGYGLARNAPEMKPHQEDWPIIPLIPWTSPHKPEFRAFDAACPRSGWADYLADGVEKLFQEYELDGLYFDGTASAWKCQNERHGCGWRDSSGTLHGTYAVLDARKLMWRIAASVRKHRPGAILDAHVSSMLTVPTLSMCDSYWTGEQFENQPRSNAFEIPLHAFRTEFMGYAHGLDAEFLCYEKRPFIFPEAIALAGIHGVEVRPYPQSIRYVSPLWAAYDKFGITDARWLPYWGDSGVRPDVASVKASAYAKPNDVLVFASQLKHEPVTTRLNIDRARLGMGTGALSARDAISGEDLVTTGDAIEVKFKDMEYRLVRVVPVR